MVYKGTVEATHLREAGPDTAMSKVNVYFEQGDHLYDMVADNPKMVLYSSFLDSMESPEVVPVVDFEERVPSQMTIGLQKDSELLELFNYNILKMYQSGLHAQILYKWLREGKPKDDTHRIFIEDAIPVEYDNVIFPSLLLLAGIVVALCLVLIECCKKHLKI